MQGLHRSVSRSDLYRQNCRISKCSIIDYYRNTANGEGKGKGHCIMCLTGDRGLVFV
jgi:hypothetical protein